MCSRKYIIRDVSLTQVHSFQVHQTRRLSQQLYQPCPLFFQIISENTAASGLALFVNAKLFIETITIIDDEKSCFFASFDTVVY